MNRFGKPTQRYPETSFGEDDDPMYPECIHYTLEYKISVEHSFRSGYIAQRFWPLTQISIEGPYKTAPIRKGDVDIWVKLTKEIIDGRDCGEIPKTQTSKDDPCEYCDNNFWDKGSHFEILGFHGSGRVKEEWHEVSEEYNKEMCIPSTPTVGPSKADIARANGSTSYSCTKDWQECGINKTLEDIITPGRPKKLSFDHHVTSWPPRANDDKEYDIACKIFKMLVAASKEDDPECAKCELLCTIIHNTIFGSIGSQSGGKPSHDTWPADCDYIDLPVIGTIFEETCSLRTGVAFENWLDKELNNKTKDPGPPWPEIEECPGCPGCD